MYVYIDFPDGSAGRVCLQSGRPRFDPWVAKIPQRREWLPTPVLWPGESHGLYSRWGHKESDTTEALSLHVTCVYIYTHIGRLMETKMKIKFLF